MRYAPPREGHCPWQPQEKPRATALRNLSSSFRDGTMLVTRAVLAASALLLGATPSGSRAADAHAAPGTMIVDLRDFRPVEGPNSGPAVYYHVVTTAEATLLRGEYRPGMETVTMGIEVPESLRQKITRVRWSWRVRAFPRGGDECTPGKGDSAASVSLAFKRGLKWYVLKYVWSTTGPLGAVCDRKRTLLLARDTIVLESGGTAGPWLRELVDVKRAFIDHFADGDPHADIPDLVGVAVMTDGDQTRSESSADWTGIELLY